MARRAIHDIISSRKDIKLEEKDVLLHPIQAWKEGIRIIPALKKDDKIHSGMFLNKQDIIHFLNQPQ